MRAAPFVPARSSRHRHAALALCRALLREGGRIPLPKTLAATESRPNPIRELVIRQFRQNRGDTSPRLVFAALTGGYKFLSLFTKAQQRASPSHKEVISYIKKRLAKPNGLVTSTLRPKPTPTPKAPRPPPLLVPTIGPDGLTTYRRGRPQVPFEDLKEGRRHIPKLFVSSENMAFLRFKKPQPHALSMAIRSMSITTQERIRRAMHLQDEGTQFAELEDQWDKLMAELADDERAAAAASRRLPEGPATAQDTYAHSVTMGIHELAVRLQRSKANGVARVQALLRIVEEEKQLAQMEAPLRAALVTPPKKTRVASKKTKAAAA